MKKMVWGYGLAAALALLAGQARAQSNSSHAQGDTTSSSATSGHSRALTGKIERFDRSKNELTLAGSGRKLKVDSSTKVMRDGSRASLDDIREGEQVRASYTGSGNALKARTVDITSAASMGTGSNDERDAAGSPSAPSTSPSDTSGKKAPHAGP